MKHLVVSLLLIAGCMRGTASPPIYPNRVCMMIALDAPGARCTDAGTSALHGDVARRDEDGGTKVCWETFDPSGYQCATPVLSRKETAALAIKSERERAKAEADAKAKADAKEPEAPPPAKAKPTTKP